MFFHLFKCDSDFHAIIFVHCKKKKTYIINTKMKWANITLQLLEVAGLLKMHLSKVWRLFIFLINSSQSASTWQPEINLYNWIGFQ